MTHVGSPNASEIYGNLRALNAFGSFVSFSFPLSEPFAHVCSPSKLNRMLVKIAGIPMKDISGFRAPMLNWTTETLKLLHDANFVVSSLSGSLLYLSNS